MSAPVVLLPGWGLGRGPLAPTAAALGARLLDLPGYGACPPAADFAAAVDALAADLPAGCTLAGWSLGALLALAVAARHPARVGRLVLVSATAAFVQRDGWPDAVPAATLADFAAAVAADPVTALPRFVAGFNRGDAHPKAVTRSLLAAAQPDVPAATLAAGLRWLGDTDLRQEAGRVAAPTLLVHGAADPLMPLPAAQALAALIPGARLETLAAAAHAPFLSDPADFVARVAAFCHEPTP